jgi:hypothetical protein
MKKFNELKQKILTESNINKENEERLFLLEELTSEQTEDLLDTVIEQLMCVSIISEAFSEDNVDSIVSQIPLDKEELEDFKITENGSEIVINWKNGKAVVSVDDVETFVPGKVMDPEALVGAVRAILQDYIVENVLREEITSDDVFDVLSKIPIDTKELLGKVFDINGEELSIDWDSKSGLTSVSLNGVSIEIKDKIYDLDSLINVVAQTIGSSETDTNSTPSSDQNVIKDPVIKKKVAIFKSLIKPRMLDIFVTDKTDRTRVREAILNYIINGKDESKIKDEITQRSLIGFLLKVIDIMTSNRDLTSLFVKHTTISSISESLILESKKKSRKKKKKSEETVDDKLDMLLKLGLVDTSIYNRAKRALNNKKAASTVPYMRNILFDLLDKLVSYIKKDSTIYNRIRLNVMKEMKGTLPSKKDLDNIKNEGREAYQSNKPKSVPEMYKNNFFTNQAWLAGYDSIEPKEKSDINVLKEESVYNEMDFWGWISPTGKVLIPSREDVEKDKFTHADVISTAGISDIRSAIDIGWIRWSIMNGTFKAEFKMMLFTVTALNKGVNSITSMLTNSSNYNYFIGPNSKNEVININNFELSIIEGREIKGNTLSEISEKLKDSISDKFITSQQKTEEKDKSKSFKEFNESLNLSAVSTISDLVNGLEIISSNFYESKEQATEDIQSLLSSVGLTYDELEEGDNKLQSDDGSEATIAIFAKESEDSEEAEGELILNLKFSESGENVTVSAEMMVSFDEDEAISLSDIEFEIDKNEEDEMEIIDPDDESENFDEENEDMDEYDDMDELEEEIAKLDEACNIYINTKDDEVISEELVSGETFNVVLLKPSTRRYVSLIVQAKNEKEIIKYVEEEMLEYVIVSIDLINIEDLPSNKNDKLN